MVRIFCLHGSGSNADIFESQTAAIRAALPSHWEWCFYQFEIPCGGLPELEGVYPGPYYTGFAIPTVKALQGVFDWLLDLIEEDGPFDGAMGFSAGGYVIQSLMYTRQKREPTLPPLFRFLVLMAGNLPWSGDPDDGVEVTDWHSFHRWPVADIDELTAFNAWAQAHPELKPDPWDATALSPIVQPLIRKFASPVYRRENYFSKALHPAVCKERLRVPTCHVFGSADSAFEGAKKMAELCDERRRLTYIHTGGHEVPRSKVDTDKVVGMIEKTVQASTNLA